MSKNSYSRVGGENVRLLQALIDEAPSYTKPTNSRNANILKSIINNTEYNEPPQSEIEELLIALKAKIGGEIEVNELTVTENGSYDAGLNKAYNPVNVEVPLDSKEITANGTYNASDDNLAGFSQVTVNVEGYKLKDIPNTPTAIATFTDGSNLPMPKLEVGIEPVQEGSGDPSPENIRPISGWSEANVSVNDGNWWDEEYQIYGSGASARIGNKNPIPCKPNTTYYITKPPSNGWKFYDNEMNLLATYYNQTYTTPSNCYYMSFQLHESYGTTYNNDVCINTISNKYYVPYNGHTYNIQFRDGDNPLTVYGGSLDVVSGELTVTDEYIASYNGETLPATWISDRDVYAEGTTPTTGAEVVYELATPLTYQLTPTQVKSLLGSNNVWADSGDVIDGKYFSEL